MLIPVLAAPTASGKTSLALEFAKQFPIEIVSADAMLVYKKLDIGTAKPSHAEQLAVKHHLIDIIQPNDSFSVADYVALAETAIEDILQRQKIPFVVGGTGFYIRSLTEGLPTVPSANLEAQQPLWDTFHEDGLEPLQEELESFSPFDAERTQRNPRRVIRALEIIRATGKAPSEFKNKPSRFSFSKCALLPTMDVLKPRIEQRTKLMLEAGWVEEVRKLLLDYPILATARQALGYETIAKHIQGELSLTEAEAQIILSTTQFAKRQRTWFKKEPNTRLIPQTATEAQEELAVWLHELSKDFPSGNA